MSLLRELHDTAYPYPVALLVLVAFTAAALWTAFSRSRVAIVAMLVLAGVWLLVNASMELDVVLTLAPGNGLTLGDLAVVPVIIVALLARRFVRPVEVVDRPRGEPTKED